MGEVGMLVECCACGRIKPGAGMPVAAQKQSGRSPSREASRSRKAASAGNVVSSSGTSAMGAFRLRSPEGATMPPSVSASIAFFF